MATYKKFYDDVYRTSCKAKVVSCEKVTDIKNTNFRDLAAEGKLLALVMDETIFFPEGGGQSCDLGTIAGYEVCDVSEKGESGEEIITHLLSFEDAAACDAALAKLTPGTEVEMEIDWARRFDNMQRHCGEHILSGIFYREYGGVNRGFHMGKDYMTIDISLEEMPEYKELTFDMCKHVELCANQVIWSNAPVIRRVFATADECRDLPLRKALAIEKNISIVCVGSIENAADCVACCGTHPATAGQIGLIKIFKVEPNKGMFRVYCEAGERAYKDYEFKHDVYTFFANRYSATPETLFEQVKLGDAKIQKLRDELYRLKKSVISERAAKIEEAVAAATAQGADSTAPSVLTFEYSDLTTDDLFAMSREICQGRLAKPLILICTDENTAVLLSDGKVCACGSLVREYAPMYGGKGGGKNESARAIFEKSDMLDTFVDLIEKHLRSVVK